MQKKLTVLLSRREAAGSLALAALGVVLAACGGSSVVASASSSGASGDGGGNDGETNGDGGATLDSGGSADAWASGGTQAMTDAAAYPSPFPTAGLACVLIPTATEGPCTEAADQVRKDISEGYTGLPMRLALRVVDASCNPIAGAKVKIWHTQITGSYSGNTPNDGMCLKSAAEGQKHYFRGVQTTDADGRVDFDSCFPGWYRSRTVHIHFTVTLNGRSFTSQLVFDQALVAEIFATHAEYKQFGQPDTTNATDNVVKADPAAYTLETARMTDGAMLASKDLIVSVG